MFNEKNNSLDKNKTSDLGGDSPNNSGLSSLKERIKDNRGRKSTAEKLREEEEERKKESAKRLYTAQQWAPIVSLPFDLRFLSTQNELWLLKDSERTSLGTSLSVLMEYLISLDPKWAALLVFLTSFVSCWGGRELQWQNLLKEQKKKAQKSVTATSEGK